MYQVTNTYHKVASSNTSCLEAHAGIYTLLMKGIFDAYVMWPFDKKIRIRITNFGTQSLMSKLNFVVIWYILYLVRRPTKW